MNKLVELFQNIPDAELKQAILEIQESEKDGIVKEDGLVRKYAKLSGEITGGFTVTDFYMTTINLLKQEAFRNVNKKVCFNPSINNIASPLGLRLDYNSTHLQYKVNKPLDQTGDYVDKKVAEDLLEPLQMFVSNVEKHYPVLANSGFYKEYELAKKAIAQAQKTTA